MLNNSDQNSELCPPSPKEFFVVGIGASAGGLNALEELFSNLSIASGAAYVVIQHLSPDFKSLMKELLERRTDMPVYRVTDGMELQPNSVFLIPPGQNLVLEKNILRLEDRRKDKNKRHELNFPIDLFFTSLAKNYGEQSIGVILSGSGSDGTRGLKAINEAGGVALVQEPKTAEFDGMPLSAISTGVVNQILPPRELAQLIYQCITAPANIFEINLSQGRLINARNLNVISKLLLEHEGLDFSQYKSSTISRRIHRRCLINNTETIENYIELLEKSSDERQILCSDLLINVTHFFRDYPAWQNLENNILPKLIAKSQPNTELRLWVTACSTGEEAYSLAILVYEALQDSDKNLRVKIFATDIDRFALDKASQGVYPLSIASDIEQHRLQRYFVAKDNCYQVMRKIREMLIFSPHDLTKDAGFTRIDLITCRNVLIYMKPDLQYQILRNLHFSLISKGILFLGEAETLGNFNAEFATLDKKWKFFQKLKDIRLPLPLRSTPRVGKVSNFRFNQTQPRVQIEPIIEQSLARLADESKSIILTIDKDYTLLHVSGDSQKIFQPPGGRITTEVTKMVVPPLQLPLNTALHRAKQKEASVLYKGIRLEHQGEVLDVSLEVIPPQNTHQHGDFYLVRVKPKIASEPLKFPEVKNFELGSEASRRIMELENELQHTRENLQALVEELETTNEEQQASNEELTASNEELQSTNEELHSVNEELHTVNIEYQSKISELTQLNDDVDNLLQSTEIGVIFLDEELRIRKFTPAVTSAISLRHTDLNRPLNDLYWKFDCPNLLELLQQVLTSKKSQELEVKLKQSDNYFLMQIHLYQTESFDEAGLVINFIDIDEIKQAQNILEREVIARQRSEEQLRINQEQLLITQERVDNIFSSLEDAVWSFDLPEKRLGYLNSSFCEIYGRTKEELIDNLNLWLDVVHPEDRDMVREAHRPIPQQAKIDLEYRICHPDGSIRWIRDRSKILFNEQGIPVRQDFIITDLTDQRETQKALRDKERSFQAIFHSMFQFIGVLNPEGILMEANQAALEFGGLTPEEVLGRPFWEAKWWTISEETQEQLRQAIIKAAQGEFVRYEVDIWGAEDRIITIDFSLKPVLDDTNRVVQLIPEGRDISQLKQARKALKRTNLELEKRVEKRTLSLAQFSDRLKQLHRLATTNHNNLSLLLADYLETGCQMLGMTTGIVSQVQEHIYKIIAVQSPLDLKVGQETLCEDIYCKEVVETQSSIAYEEIGNNKTMQQHPVYLDRGLESFIGTPIFVEGKLYGTLNFSDTKPRELAFTSEEITIIELMARDIGNSIAVQGGKMALQQSESLFRNTFDQAAVGVAHVAPKGNFIRVNKRFCEIIDFENDLLLQKTFQEITHPEDLEIDLEYVRQLLAGEIEQYTLEKRYIKRDRSIVWVNLTVSLVRNNLSQPDYFIAVIQNISDRKGIELELKQSHQKLEQANQAKDNFIAHMSHELRTPLNSTIGFSEILKSDSSLTSDQVDMVNLINQSGHHLLTLINDILDLSKFNANKFELTYAETNLIDFLQDIASIFEISAQNKGLEFLLHLPDNLPTIVNTDKTKLRQILINLLSNAIKFTTQGNISLTVSCQQGNPKQDNNSEIVHFQVEDTGRGIPENYHNLILEPFEQLAEHETSTEGTGLGLPICQKILTLMNSQLHFTSEVDQGSCFWFDLTLETIPNYLPSTPQIHSSQLPQQTLASPCKALVIDDNVDNRLLLVKYLQSLGFTTQEASNGREGLAIARKFQPQVILLDLLMPIMDGRETLASLRQEELLANRVVFVVSANVQSLQDSRELPCEAFISKPVDFERLITLLDQHLELEWSITPKQTVTQNDLVADTPPEEALLRLLDLVNSGKIRELSSTVEALAQEEPQYVHFVQSIRSLIDNYAQEELGQLFEQLTTKS